MEIAESAAAGTPSCDMTDNKMFVEAGKDDALSIIGLRHKIWSTTYRGIYPDHMIDDFDWAWHEEKELSRINDPAYSVYLIQKDGQNIGYLTIHQANVITLQSLYIVSEYQRQGVGRAAKSVWGTNPGFFAAASIRARAYVHPARTRQPAHRAFPSD